MVWYDTVPTVWNNQGTVMYINCPDAMLPQDEASQEWVKRAKERGEYPSIITRAAVDAALKDVDTEAVASLGLKAATLNIKPPTKGTDEEKQQAVSAKMSEVVPVAEWEKVSAFKMQQAEEARLADPGIMIDPGLKEMPVGLDVQGGLDG